MLRIPSQHHDLSAAEFCQLTSCYYAYSFQLVGLAGFYKRPKTAVFGFIETSVLVTFTRLNEWS